MMSLTYRVGTTLILFIAIMIFVQMVHEVI